MHLSNKVIHSANEFDRISAELVPKHQQLANEIGVLVTVANDLDTLVNQAGNLPVLAHQINQGTAHDIQLANGIPALVGNVIARVNGVNSPLSALNDTIATDGTMINQIASNIAALKAPLHTIDGQAQQIAGVLDVGDGLLVQLRQDPRQGLELLTDDRRGVEVRPGGEEVVGGVEVSDDVLRAALHDLAPVHRDDREDQQEDRKSRQDPPEPLDEGGVEASSFEVGGVDVCALVRFNAHVSTPELRKR